MRYCYYIHKYFERPMKYKVYIVPSWPCQLPFLSIKGIHSPYNIGQSYIGKGKEAFYATVGYGEYGLFCICVTYIHV
jgi:hypothetical protein